MAFATDEQHRVQLVERRDPRGRRARIRPRRPAATRWCRSPSASSTLGAGTPSPIAPSTSAPRMTALQSAPNSLRTPFASRIARSPASAACAICSTVSSASRRGSGKRDDELPFLDRRAVDLTDLAHEQRHEVFGREHDRELVDRDVFAALEHVDTDDVGTEAADARRDAPQRARTVGEPDPNDQARAVADDGILRVAHGESVRRLSGALRAVHRTVKL